MILYCIVQVIGDTDNSKQKRKEFHTVPTLYGRKSFYPLKNWRWWEVNWRADVCLKTKLLIRDFLIVISDLLTNRNTFPVNLPSMTIKSESRVFDGSVGQP